MNRKRKISLSAMVLFYLTTGTLHFLRPQPFLNIMPPWLPHPLFLVYFSGACEALFALLLISPKTRKTGAWLLIVLLLAVFPANIQMSINYWNTPGTMFWISLLRLPLQIVLISWAYRFTKKNETV
jgi:uncharacterized membrane protein